MADLLRLATCGSVDDGKSTLIGRLLHDTRQIADDQIEHLQAVSARRGSELDLALLTDGLRAEREQGITIDVAYRQLRIAGRRIVLADCPGHEQYTRNMVTGASTADAAVLLVDARHGVVTQTRRHLAICATLRVPRVVVAVNKMDLVGWRPEPFVSIEAEVASLAGALGAAVPTCVPLSALTGDHVVVPSESLDWHDGPPLAELLARLPADGADRDGPLRMPVQWVLRPAGGAGGGRRFAGRLARGAVRAGDEIVALPSGLRARVVAVEMPGGEVESAAAPASVALRLDRELDIARGDVVCAVADAPTPRRELAATVCWMHERPARAGARLLVKHGTRTTRAIVERIDGRLDLGSLAAVPAGALEVNDLGRVALRLAAPLAADDFAACRATGAFILIDEATNATVAAGMVG